MTLRKLATAGAVLPHLHWKGLPQSSGPGAGPPPANLEAGAIAMVVSASCVGQETHTRTLAKLGRPEVHPGNPETEPRPNNRFFRKPEWADRSASDGSRSGMVLLAASYNSNWHTCEEHSVLGTPLKCLR